MALTLATALIAAACTGGSRTRVGPSTTTSTSSVAPTSSGVPEARSPAYVTAALLTTMRTEGFNDDPKLDRGHGALYVNWRSGTVPLVANIGAGYLPDPPGTHRHDPLTEIRYLHDLWVERTLHPDDAATVAEIARYTPIVKLDYAAPRDTRGWIYDELIDLARLSGDAFYRDAAHAEAAFIDSTLFHRGIGAIYTISADFPSGYYRADLAVDSASALLQAAVDFHRPDWGADGTRALDFVYAHAFLPQEGTFLMVMTNVVGPGGGAAPETVMRHPYRNETIDGGVSRMGELGQMALSLLHAARATGSAAVLAKAVALLDPLTSANNALHLWDPVHGGYFAGIAFPGDTPTSAGIPTVQDTYKESGRQGLMLEAFRLADTFPEVHDAYMAMEQSMTAVVVDKIYYAPSRGVLYETTPSFEPVQPTWTWVTSEAIGITLAALLSLERSVPW